MLDQARHEMQEALAANREKAVQAITQKNRLQMMIEEAEKKSIMLEQQAVMALKQNNRETAKALLREKAVNDQTLGTLRTTFQQAVQTVESIKLAIKHQEEEVRRKTAEALAMKAQWKQAQIQNSITKALEGLSFETQFESLGGISERIRDVQSEAAARQEMLATSMQGKMIQIQTTTADITAEEELAKLEQQLGLAKLEPKDVKILESTTSTEVDTQLKELEKRVEKEKEDK